MKTPVYAACRKPLTLLASLLCAATTLTLTTSAQAAVWHLNYGCATSIAAGDGLHPFAISRSSVCPTVPDGSVYSWTGSGWTEIATGTGSATSPAKPISITASWEHDANLPTGFAWYATVLDDNGNFWEEGFNGDTGAYSGSWDEESYLGTATAVSASWGVFPQGWGWMALQGGAIMINNSNCGNGWVNVGGGHGIAIGGSALGLGGQPAPGPGGNYGAWVIDPSHNVWSTNPLESGSCSITYTEHSTQGVAITVGLQGLPWVVSTDNRTVLGWNGSGFSSIGAPSAHNTVAISYGNYYSYLWALDSTGAIFVYY